MKKGTSINIDTELSREEKITREGGEKLRKLILKSALPLTIDFNHKPVASVSFWDESVAKLILEGWSEKEISQNLVLKNIHDRDQVIIKKLIQARLKGE